MATMNRLMVVGEYSTKEFVKLALVLIGITLAAFVLQDNFGEAGLEDWLRWFMGVFFVVFGTFKLVGYGTFAEMFGAYDIVAKRFKLYAYAYPFVELGLGLAYLNNYGLVVVNWITLIIMAASSIGVAQEIKRRRGIHCACLGNVIKLPLSTVSLLEDVGMGLTAIIMLLFDIIL